MKISFITLFPDIIQSYISTGLLARAQANTLFEFEVFNIRDAVTKNYKSADDTVYGGSDGMLIQYDPLVQTLNKVQRDPTAEVIYLSPQGQNLNQNLINKLKVKKHLILISGRYAGVDQRFIKEHVDLELSIGDYVLCGGELPSLVLVETISRQVSGVLGSHESAQNDSFTQGLLEAPQFTKPNEVSGMKVPEVLVSGDHKKIELWKNHMSVLVTLKKREDLILPKVNEINWKQIDAFYKNVSQEDKNILQINDLDQKIEKYKNGTP
ncbi:MAG: tRNA (guanosine(37)-N1)-methyltransferase TrmD [Bdellovibrionaceae bacterium]|nr:tRNA (guanosine(37)-N1)-methyltransferase TrmD [Pseudobdellovibrionaceae bacterium]